MFLTGLFLLRSGPLKSEQKNQDQVVQYSLSNNPKLPTQSATLLLLPLTSEQSSIVETMADETKMSLSITDVLMN